MKKILCIVCAIVLLFAFTACGYKVQDTKLATNDEITSFFESKTGLEAGSYKFKISYSEEDVTVKNRVNSSTSVKGSVNYKEDGSYEMEYTAKRNEKSKAATVDGIEKGNRSVKEKGVVFSDGLFQKKAFYDVTEKIKTEKSKISNRVKSTLENDQELFHLCPLPSSFSEYVLKMRLGGGYVFIDEDKIRYVDYESPSLFSDLYMTEVTFVYEGMNCKSIRIELENANERYVCEYTFGEYNKIAEPKDKAEYKTE